MAQYIFHLWERIMNKKFLAILFGSVLTLPAVAGHTQISNEILNEWGGRPDWITCGENNTNGCISKGLVDAKCDAATAKITAPDGFAFFLMLAREVNKNGAYFCPTMFHRNSNNSTIFKETGGNQTCVWLCRQGWTGDKCQSKQDNFTDVCDVTPFLRENYNDTKSGSAENIEWKFMYIASDKLADCKDSTGKYQRNTEHDILLAVDKFLPSGNGAFVRMMEFSARHNELQVYPANGKEQELLCKRGYKQNKTKTDCEPINASECKKAILNQKMCSGWTADKYDEKKHMLDLNDGCYKYKCKTAGQAFVSTTDHSCTDCTTDIRGGTHPINGTCVKCDTGMIFSDIDGECKETISLNNTDLAYGQNKTKDDFKDNNDTTDQCWAKKAPEEYKECVMGEN